MPIRHSPPHPRAALAALAFTALTLAACDPGARDAATSLRVERDTIGDTIVVRTLAGSAWGDSARLVEELRIGEAEGNEAYRFARVDEMAVGADGTIYAYDGTLHLLRAYDASGRYLRTLGGAGEGPGEYREADGLVVHRDGRVILHDPRLGRMVPYTPAGEPLDAWSFPSGLFTGDALATDTAGYVYSKILRSATYTSSSGSRV